METLYREHILDHFRNPRHRGRLPTYAPFSVAELLRRTGKASVGKPHATASFEVWNPLCGDKLIIDLQYYRCGTSVVLKNVRWEGEGCAISLAAASILSEEIIGKSVEEIQKLTYDDMLNLLKINLTPARLKCGTLALEGVKGALAQNV